MSNTTPLLPVPIFRAFDSANLPLSGGKLYAYAAGTTTPLDTYSDAAGSTPNANPVVLDSTGSAIVRLGTSAYKFVLKDSSGTTQWTIDNYEPIGDAPSFSGSVSVGGNLSVTGNSTLTGAVASGALTVTGNITLSGTITIGSTLLIDSGSFTGTLTGCTTSPTQTFYWYRVGQVVTLSLRANINGTSSTTSMNITGIPVAIQPAHAKAIHCTYIRNNSVQFLDGYAYVDVSTALIFFLTGGAAFTGANTKGLDAGWSISYGLD